LRSLEFIPGFSFGQCGLPAKLNVFGFGWNLRRRLAKMSANISSIIELSGFELV
jgi:hypothetical protein